MGAERQPEVTVQSLAGQTRPLELCSPIGDFLHAAAYTGLQEKAEGLAQDMHHTVSAVDWHPDWVPKLDHENIYTKAGAVAGNVADFFIIARTLGSGREKWLGRTKAIPFLEAGISGTIFSGLQPVNEANFAIEKRNQMIHGFTTFAAMDGIGWGLNRVPGIAASKSFLVPIGVDFTAGVGGGLTQSAVGQYLGEKPFSETALPNMAEYAAFNVMFGAGSRAWDHGIPAAARRIDQFSDWSAQYLARRAEAGKPLFSLGPLEIVPKGATAQAYAHATEDGLTGLLNKRGGDQRGEFVVAQANRSKDPLSVLYGDLDGFKGVNDKLGHGYGDQVLKVVADGVRGRFKRGTDVPIRDGGDEFLVLMPDTPLANAETAANRFETDFRVGAAKEAPKPSALAQNYEAVATQIRDLPTTTTVAPGETLPQVAQRVLEQRQKLTGEHVTETAVNMEIDRLSKLNGDLTGRTLPSTITTYGQGDLAGLADQAAFRFLPQIGQILKSEGVITEAQLLEVLSAQKQEPAAGKSLIGDLLSQRGLADSQQILDAFGTQASARQSLYSTRVQLFGSGEINPALEAPVLFTAEWLQPFLKGNRGSIPSIARPNLELNGVRVLQPNEPPAPGELTVGISTGVVELRPGESWLELKSRGDHMMYEKKQIRKGLGLRQDRNAFGTN